MSFLCASSKSVDFVCRAKTRFLDNNMRKKQIRFLQKKEVDQILSAVVIKNWRDTRDLALITVLFSTGLRIHEALALRCDDFREDLQGTLELSIVGKGGWSRTIYFSPSTLKLIKNWLEVKKDVDEELFPITARCAQIMVRRRSLFAGLEGVHPHTFRHSFGTYILGKTGNIRLCQEMLGHRSISSTQIYTHITNGELKAEHKKLFK